MRSKTESNRNPSQSDEAEKPEQLVEARTEEEVEAQVQAQTQQKDIDYITGMQLNLLIFVCLLCIFLANFEITVISTSLVSITNDLHDFGRNSWVVTAYLLSYTGFMVVTAKLSDTVGRKPMVMFSVAVFTVFSGGCGAARTMNELIVLRAFQGLGGSGVYSIVNTIIFELVPPEKYPKYSLLVAADFAISFLSGPLLGGLINRNTTWRWVFLMNVPAGVVALIMIIFFMPNGFPYHRHDSTRHSVDVKMLDVVGAGIMIAAITLLITAFGQVSNFVPWASAKFLAPMVVSVLSLGVFLAYERFISLGPTDGPEPVFPWHFCQSRVIMGLLINSLLVGGIFTACVIQIPLRFQAVNNESPWHAGVRLIPFGLATPVGGTLSAAICGKRRFPPIYMIFMAATLQIVGIVFMSRQTLDHIMWKGQYGLQFLTGLGSGMAVTTTQIMVPFIIVEKKHLATGTSAAIQFRFLGAALTVAIVTAVMNTHLKNKLILFLSPVQLAQMLRTTEAIDALHEPLRARVKGIFLEGYNMQLQILIGIAAAMFPATMLMWEKEQVRIA